MRANRFARITSLALLVTPALIGACGSELGAPEVDGAVGDARVSDSALTDAGRVATTPERDAGMPSDAGTVCVPDCGSRVCGDDGCGGSCGVCTTDDYCTPVGTCERDVWYAHRMVTPADAFHHTEGPAVDGDGRVFAVNFEREGTIGFFQPEGTVHDPLGTPALFLDLNASSATNHRCNGIRILSNARTMVCVSLTTDRLFHIDLASRAIERDVPAGMGSVNDLAVGADDTVYVTSPGTGNIYRIGDRGTAEPEVIAHVDGSSPNGIDLAPDESRLYFNGWDFGPESRNILWYADLDGSDVGVPVPLVRFGSSCIPDGLRTDLDGNLYMACTAGGRRVLKIREDGTIEREIATAQGSTTNVTFGGHDGRTVFVTQHPDGMGGIGAFRVPVAGRGWRLLHP